MKTLNIAKGPHGLLQIDTHVVGDETPRKPFTVKQSPLKGPGAKLIIYVQDAQGNQVADAYIQADASAEKREDAKQFLLDLINAAF